MDAVQRLGVASLSSVVNAAPEREVDRRARAAALERLLATRAAGLDPLAAGRPSEHLRALLAGALRRGREVIAPTVVCTELARGRARTRALEAIVSRHDRSRGERPALRLIDTDLAPARQVGAILVVAGSSNVHVVAAHVVAVCVAPGGGLVVTSGAGDIAEPAAAVPAARVRTTHP